MKKTVLLLGVAAICSATVASAELESHRAGQNLHALAPIHTLNARNVQRPTFTLSHEEFDNVRIDEAKRFDGYTQKAELVIPFGERNRWALRLELPFRTKGSAWSLERRHEIDIEGDGGIFDFACLIVQRELSTTAESGINSSLYFGIGQRTTSLETSINDEYNHRGRVARLGYNVDNARPEQNLRVQGTADVRVYSDTDDLNPSDGSDSFTILNMSGALVYNARGLVKPVVEVLYSTDFDRRNIIQAVPEFIVPLGERVEIKGGFAYGYSAGEGVVRTATVKTTFMF